MQRYPLPCSTRQNLGLGTAPAAGILLQGRCGAGRPPEASVQALLPLLSHLSHTALLSAPLLRQTLTLPGGSAWLALVQHSIVCLTVTLFPGHPPRQCGDIFLFYSLHCPRYQVSLVCSLDYDASLPFPPRADVGTVSQARSRLAHSGDWPCSCGFTSRACGSLAQWEAPEQEFLEMPEALFLPKTVCLTFFNPSTCCSSARSREEVSFSCCNSR